MSLKDLKSKSDSALAGIVDIKKSEEPRFARPTTAPGATALMQPTIDALNDRAKTAEAKVAEFEQKLTHLPTDLPLDMVLEVDSRKRKLTPEQFDELKSNLANNPLIHPIAVRRQLNGLFEIISGHNRFAAFRALGRQTIPVVVLDIEDTIVDRSSFYANLLQPSLPDYEKYLGFSKERERTGQTQKQMARDAGISESMVSMLFSFEQLPAKARELIEERPELIGMSCAYELAKLTREGKSEQVIEAVLLLVEGKLTQKEALKFAAKSIVVTPRNSSSNLPVKIRVGRLEFCQYVSRGKTLRIDFKNEENLAEAEEFLNKALHDLAKQLRGDSKFES
ncbi:MAG: ParB/RepB/Spo0J family partition protein [Gammaproteobacteria bacterium]|nr:ParB/RepB/Spo0J family partition protein [Gammaproteobacteria bacterium]